MPSYPHSARGDYWTQHRCIHDSCGELIGILPTSEQRPVCHTLPIQTFCLGKCDPWGKIASMCQTLQRQRVRSKFAEARCLCNLGKFWPSGRSAFLHWTLGLSFCQSPHRPIPKTFLQNWIWVLQARQCSEGLGRSRGNESVSKWKFFSKACWHQYQLEASRSPHNSQWPGNLASEKLHWPADTSLHSSQRRKIHVGACPPPCVPAPQHQSGPVAGQTAPTSRSHPTLCPIHLGERWPFVARNKKLQVAKQEIPSLNLYQTFTWPLAYSLWTYSL